MKDGGNFVSNGVLGAVHVDDEPAVTIGLLPEQIAEPSLKGDECFARWSLESAFVGRYLSFSFPGDVGMDVEKNRGSRSRESVAEDFEPGPRLSHEVFGEGVFVPIAVGKDLMCAGLSRQLKGFEQTMKDEHGAGPVVQEAQIPVHHGPVGDKWVLVIARVLGNLPDADGGWITSVIGRNGGAKTANVGRFSATVDAGEAK